MSPKLQAICAAVIALAAGGKAGAVDLTPNYIGTDYGMARYGGRVYVGYALGSTEILSQESTHYLELMGYSLGSYRDLSCIYPAMAEYCRHDLVRANGLALNWAAKTSLSENWSANTRVGVSYTHARIFDTTDTHYGESVGSIAGAGLAYSVDKHFSVRADVNYMPIKVRDDYKSRPNAVTTGIDYKF